jgi:hypothetical protein
MTKHNSFDQSKNKLNRLTLQQNKNVVNIKKKESNPFTSLARNTHYKSSKLLFESDWTIAEREKITSAVTQEKGLLLPEKLNYNFSVDLDVTEEFLPYVQVELLVRSNPDTQVKGVYQYTSSGKREIDFNLYKWLGITQASLFPCGDTPQPFDAYDFIPANPPTAPFWKFKYKTSKFPVPDGTDPSYLLPVAHKYLEPNGLRYLICGSQFYSAWDTDGYATFHELIALVGGDINDAKDILKAYDNISYDDELPNFKGHVANINALPLTGNEENDFYVQDNIGIFRVWTSENPIGEIENWASAGSAIPKAYQTTYAEQVETAKQTKKIIKISDNKYNLSFDGYLLLLSEAKTTTSWSELLTPSYEPNGGDIEIKAKVYIKNPKSFTEVKHY